jgi:hypothetical protein
LGYYHERKDETRNIGLGPEHDWSSHAADAFGLMAVHYEAPVERQDGNDERRPVGRMDGSMSELRIATEKWIATLPDHAGQFSRGCPLFA